jgi:hypothetical protein
MYGYMNNLTRPPTGIEKSAIKKITPRVKTTTQRPLNAPNNICEMNSENTDIFKPNTAALAFEIIFFETIFQKRRTQALS